MEVIKYSDGSRVITLDQDELATLAKGEILQFNGITLIPHVPAASAEPEESDPVGGEG